MGSAYQKRISLVFFVLMSRLACNNPASLIAELRLLQKLRQTGVERGASDTPSLIHREYWVRVFAETFGGREPMRKRNVARIQLVAGSLAWH